MRRYTYYIYNYIHTYIYIHTCIYSIYKIEIECMRERVQMYTQNSKLI